MQVRIAEVGAPKHRSLARSALAAGFDDLSKLDQEPALEPLRQRADFMKLRPELEQKLKTAMK